MTENIIRVDIIDNEPENPKNRVLETCYLLNPNRDKLDALRKAIEQRLDDENSEYKGLWDIREYINKNFLTLDIERMEIEW
jgi:hypothetical protein